MRERGGLGLTECDHRPAPPANVSDSNDVPARDRRIAHVIAVLTLPSGVWRILLVAGAPVMRHTSLPATERMQIVALSLVAELAAFACLGLVRPWGERVPGWVPHLHHRRIPPAVVVVPATIAAAALTVLWTVALCRAPFSGFFDYFPSTAAKALVIGCYLPLLAWGPLLAVLTVSYHRRRTGGAD